MLDLDNMLLTATTIEDAQTCASGLIVVVAAAAAALRQPPRPKVILQYLHWVNTRGHPRDWPRARSPTA